MSTTSRSCTNETLSAPAISTGAVTSRVWRCLGLSLFLLGAVVVPLHAADDGHTSSADEAPQLTLEGLFHPEKQIDYDGADPPPVRWLPDDRLAVRQSDVWSAMQPSTGSAEPWPLPRQMRDALEQLDGIDAKQAEQAAVDLDELDEALRWSLIRVGDGLVWYDVDSATARWITRDASGWQVPQVDPTGKRIAFVRAGDLYVYDLEERTSRRLTYDGSDTILNGYLDWVYQEELYGRGNFRGFWWSPDGRRIAFLRLDQSQVPRFAVIDSRKPAQAVEQTRYPLAGDPISTVSLQTIDVERDSRVTVEEIRDTSGENPATAALIVNVSWRDADQLCYQLQNRRQSWLELYSFDLSQNRRQRLLRDEGGPWVERLESPRWIDDRHFVWLSDSPEGRRHLQRVDSKEGKRTFLTAGNWNVWSIEHVDVDSDQVICIASIEPGNRVPIRVPLQPHGSAVDNPPVLGPDNGWHDIDVSPSGTWFADFHSTIHEPVSVVVRPIEPETSEDPLVIHRPEDAPLESLDLPPVEQRAFEIDGVTLPALQFLPADFDPQQTWPLIIHTYGGPQAAVAVNRFRGNSTLWHHWLASQGYVVLLVDVRSSGGRGIADTWNIDGRMGFDELADLESILDQLAGEPWFDRERVGLWGWSYGGYLTAFSLLHSDRFRCGIAGAPVTDWRNYDAIYTERYMDLPERNPEGYEQTRLAAAAEDLHGRLLLIHGARDDNVHLSNTLQLAAALQQAGEQFDLMIYPGQRHSVTNPPQRFHLYQLMADFWDRWLKP